MGGSGGWLRERWRVNIEGAAEWASAY
jgi:hypothetical protein